MDRKNSLYGSNRLSNLNSISICSPIAESTHIQKSNLNNKFPWGGKISPIHKSSSSNLEKSKSTSSSPSIKMSPINKSSIIDPRIYTDIRSKGLASRIVKYHDDSLKLNRSLSASNLYNKPGQFPIVHLNRSQIQYKANRNRPASVVRIAPPDKVVFQANTRSSILRSPSVVPTVNLRKTTSELSCENRPILHPAESDLVPTRSVLDALKEISRKRINSDDLDGSDVAKKYCKETEDVSPRNVNANNLSISINNTYAIKRQRETQISPNSRTVNTEQAIKKRMYIRNNDITSSLSSSLHMLTPKRKLSEVQIGNNNSGSSENSISPKSKQSCNESNNKEKPQVNNKSNLNIPQSSYTITNQITPLPPTPTVNEAQHHPLNSYQVSTKGLFENSYVKNNSIPVISTSKENSNQQQKPKLTLFNKNYDDEEFKKNLNSRKILREETEDDEVKFVKPRNSSAEQFEKNPIIERMKQSRLALMLKGLRGELNNEDSKDENDEDETDIPQKSTNTGENKETTDKTESEKTLKLLTDSAVTTSASMSFATKTTDSTSIISSAVVVSPRISQSSNLIQSNVGSNTGFNFGLKTTGSNSSSSMSVNQNPSSTAATSTGGFSFGLKSTANTISGITTLATTSTTTTISPTTTAATIGGFSFNAPKTVSTSPTTLTNNTTSAFLTKSSLTNNTNSTPQQNQSGFSFGNQTQQTSGFSLTSSKSAFVPVSGVPKSTEQKTETTSTTTTASTFSFGGQNSSDKQQLIEKNPLSGDPNSSSVKPVFGMFSSNPQSTFSTSTTQAITATTSNTSNQAASTFPFNAASSNTQQKSAFVGFGPQSNKTFGNFSSTSQPSTATTSTTSIFGSNPQEKTTANTFNSQLLNTNNTSSFGNVTGNSTETPKATNLFENKSSTTGFTFGSIKNLQQANTNKESTTSTPFAFGSTSTSTSSTAGGFSFQNATTSANITTATTTASQFSFSGSGNSAGISSFSAPSTTSSGIDASKSGFNFGTPLKDPETTKTFSFTLPNQTQTPSTSTTSAPGFSFGGSSSNENKQSPFSFGGTTTAATAATTTNATLSTSNFSFTKPASQNTFGSLTANKSFTGGFSFGSSTSTENKPTTFGAFNVTSTAEQTQAELPSARKFSFSNVSNAKNEIKTSETPAASSSSIFSGNSQNSSFGNPPSLGQAKSFNFGSTNNAPNTSQNLFGGSTSSTGTGSIFGSNSGTLLGNKPASSSFSFGSNTTNQQGTSNSSPFAFGSSSNTTAPAAGLSTLNNTSKPFTFGPSSISSTGQQQQQSTDPSKPFAFGAPLASNNANQFTSNLNKPPSFNFSAQSNTTANTATGIGGPVNEVNQSTNAFQDRPIRRATRRLMNKNS